MDLDEINTAGLYNQPKVSQANDQLALKGDCCFTAAHYDTHFIICSGLVVFKAVFLQFDAFCESSITFGKFHALEDGSKVFSLALMSSKLKKAQNGLIHVESS